jgi:hypothetical protein
METVRRKLRELEDRIAKIDRLDTPGGPCEGLRREIAEKVNPEK